MRSVKGPGPLHLPYLAMSETMEKSVVSPLNYDGKWIMLSHAQWVEYEVSIGLK